MKLPWRKMLKRFLPGVACLAVVLAFLAWAYEPRPMAVSTFPFDSRNLALQFAVSPDGRHLATFGEEVFSTHMGRYSYLTLHDLHTQQQLFTSKAVFDLPRFDDNSVLVMLSIQAKTGNRQLVRMQPNTQECHVTWEGEPRPFRGLDPGKSQLFLSPDTRTLLHLHHDYTVVHIIMIDGLTGNTRSTIQIPDVQPSTLCGLLCTAAFSPDCKHAAIQTLEGDPPARKCHWRWIDVQTGQVLQHVVLPDEMNTEGLLYASNTSPIALAFYQGKRCLVFLRGNQICTKEVADMPLPADFDYTKLSWFAIRHYHPLPEQNLVLCDYADLVAPVNGSKNEMLARHYVFCQEVDTDTLGRTSPVILKAWNNKDDDYQRWFYIAALPGPYLVYQHDEGAAGKLQEWIKSIYSWLGIRHTTAKTLYLIDAKTGTFLHRLQLPHAQAASLSKDQSKLMILSASETQIELRTYDFPLHLPWLLIWSWALGVTAGFVLLVEGIRWAIVCSLHAPS